MMSLQDAYVIMDSIIMPLMNKMPGALQAKLCPIKALFLACNVGHIRC